MLDIVVDRLLSWERYDMDKAPRFWNKARLLPGAMGDPGKLSSEDGLGFVIRIDLHTGSHWEGSKRSLLGSFSSSQGSIFACLPSVRLRSGVSRREFCAYHEFHSFKNSRNYFCAWKALFHPLYPAFLNKSRIKNSKNFRVDRSQQVEQKLKYN